MTKEMIKEEITYLSVDCRDAVVVISELQSIVDNNRPNEVSLQLNYIPYSDGEQYIAIYVKRLETDEEELLRECQWEQRKNDREKYEKEQYELLKKKFG